jgi:predicted ATPase
MLRAGRDAEEAMASFRRGVHIARAQGAVLFELRATRELARLRLQQNGRGEALQLLNPVVARFTEGFGTEDLKDAYALLETMQT